MPAHLAPEAGFALVIAVTTYLSLVVGELVPKQLALSAAEPIAVIAARPMVIMSRITAPLPVCRGGGKKFQPQISTDSH